MNLEILKIRINKSGHFSRKAMLLGYAALICIAILSLVGFTINLTLSKPNKTTTTQKQISIDQEKIKELENFGYLGKPLNPDIGVGRTDPFSP